MENWELRMENGELRIENGELKMENWEWRIETIKTKYYEEIIFVFGSCCCYGGMFT